MSTPLLPTIAGILLLGIGAQLLARRVKLPSVLFLILIGGVLGDQRLALGVPWLGPVTVESLGLVTLETFGRGLSTVVGLSVAIIVFDGAFDLQARRLREASTVTIRLVTVGAVTTLAGTALAVWLFLGISWELSMLVGALLVATGPTVIIPVLEVVELREHVAATLEAEGIVNDVTAAIAAVVIYEVFVLGDGGVGGGLVAFVTRFGIGIAAGLVAAAVVYVLATREVTPGSAPQAARFLALSGALGSFALAESFAPEAGIAAAATAGLVLGNLELPHRETMAEFGRDATLIVLSFVFISLAALLDVQAVLQLGIAGIGVVLFVTLVVRPLVVALATVGQPRFTLAERLFLSAVAPRGIVPASVATLFAVELAVDGNSSAAQTLVGAVFVVIFVTVVVQAGLARQIAATLGVIPMRTIIVGGGRVGSALAQRLEDEGEFVVVVEDDEERIERAREEGFTVHAGDGTETPVLREAGIESAKNLVAATGDDDENLLVCQLAASKFDVDRVFSRVNDPENVGAFRSMDVTAIDAPMATAMTIGNEIQRPALAHWMTRLADDHDVREVEVTAQDLVGRTLRQVDAAVPDGCILAIVGRGEEAKLPDADDVLEEGEHVTFIGDVEAVDRAVKRFHPHE